MPEGLSRELLSKYRDLVHSRYGIQYHGNKIDILEMKLQKLAHARNYSLEDFYGRVVNGDPAAIDELLREITVGHTFFFREQPHLQYLVNDIERKRIARPLIWCAASSTGEEPYSIVIYLLERNITNFVLIGSDVNAHALKAMDNGVYHANQFQSTSESLQKKYFYRIDEFTWGIRPDLRDYIRIKRLNLHNDLQFEDQFDYIFCRNVMIYFDEAGRRRVLDNLVTNLKSSGLLFVGHAEALLSLPHELKKEATAVYRRVP